VPNHINRINNPISPHKRKNIKSKMVNADWIFLLDVNDAIRTNNMRMVKITKGVKKGLFP
jgi:hypothetical protein